MEKKVEDLDEKVNKLTKEIKKLKAENKKNKAESDKKIGELEGEIKKMNTILESMKAPTTTSPVNNGNSGIGTNSETPSPGNSSFFIRSPFPPTEFSTPVTTNTKIPCKKCGRDNIELFRICEDCLHTEFDQKITNATTYFQNEKNNFIDSLKAG